MRWSGSSPSRRRAGRACSARCWHVIWATWFVWPPARYSAGLRKQGQPLLARVFEVIDERYSGPLSTADVGRAVDLTAGDVTTLVRRRTGRAVVEWILERRMAAARELLLTTDLSAESIAGRVRFCDPTYVNRRFRAHHGTAPGRRRAAARTR